MHSIVFHNRSAHFGKQFRMTHGWPLLYTVRHGGINTMFWARYTEHLPVDYKPGRRPPSHPEWDPSAFQPSYLEHADYVMFQRATPENLAEHVLSSERIEGLLRASARIVGCRGLWCLFETGR
jgi:hypothetical protein